MQLGLLLICIAAISWGTTGTTMVLLSQVAPVSPLLVGFWRMAIAAPFLLLIASRTPKLWRKRSSQEIAIYLGMGFCMATYQVGYFWAVPLAGVAVTALVAICSSPIFIALLAAWQLKEKLTGKVYAALTLGVVGTILLIDTPEAHTTGRGGFLLGVGLALMAGFAYATYAVTAKATVAQQEPLHIAAFSFSAAAVWLTPTLLLPTTQVLTKSFLPEATDSWLNSAPYLLYLGLVPTGIAYAIYLLGLRQTPATISSIAVLLEPLTATLLGLILFKEPMGVRAALGAAFLLGAIALLTLKPAQLAKQLQDS